MNIDFEQNRADFERVGLDFVETQLKLALSFYRTQGAEDRKNVLEISSTR